MALDLSPDDIGREPSLAKDIRAAEPWSGARQRLEDQFRQQFLEQHACKELAPAGLSIGSEPAATGNGRTS